MKLTPEYIAQYTGLTESSVRRRVIAVAKKEGKRKFKYSRDLYLNGLGVPTLEDIAMNSRDEDSKMRASELLQSVQSGSELIAVKKGPVALQSEWTKPVECTALGMRNFSAISVHEFTAPDAVKKVKPERNFSALNFIESHLFTAINIIDIALVFIGLTQLYGLVGFALATMGSLFFIKAQIIARNAQLRQSNHNAIKVVGWMCGITFILHSITFWNAMEFGLVDVTGDIATVGNNIAKCISAFGPAAFVSILAFKAVETEHKIAKEKFNEKKAS